MKNPFKIDGFMLPLASINSAYVGNDKVSDLFSQYLLIKAINTNAESLGISGLNESNSSLVLRLSKCLDSDDKLICETAYKISTFFGEKLAKIIVNFFNPSKESLQNRNNWSEKHWNYWKTINTVILAGGILSPNISKVFKECMDKELALNRLSKEVLFIDNTYDFGLRGLAKKSNENTLVFDFGQTNIKRGMYCIDNKENITVLKSVKSKFFSSQSQDENVLINEASKLHKYTLKVILKTIEETNFKGSFIRIALSNYVQNGFIKASNFGYGILAFLGGNYQDKLIYDLSFLINRKINVELFHDTSAMALNFDKKNTAVISIGTAFGIAFID